MGNLLDSNGTYIRSGTQGGHGLYIFVFILLLAVLALGAYFIFRDMKGPEIVLTPSKERITLAPDITLHISDRESGVRSVAVSIRDNGNTQPLFEHTFSESRQQQTLTFNLKDVGLKDGVFNLEVTARDTSFAGFGRGNSTTISRRFLLDTQAPTVTFQTPPANLRRSGTTVFVYTLSEPVESTGIKADSWYFPAFEMEKKGQYCCFITFPLYADAVKFVPELVAKDLAGNEARVPVPLHLQDRNFHADRLNITDVFLSKKALELEVLAPNQKTPLERYIHINKVVRVENQKVLASLAAKTSPKMLWSGEFQRLQGSALRAYFGESRTYAYKGEVIDHQTHMGLDLASISRSEIPAANTGKVLYSGPLGIYGNLVVIDHGMGLMSLYSHMSKISVAEGEEVVKGQVIGYTGTTGLALGDHLHFGILVNGVQVQPLDWLDKNWVKAAISDRIDAAVRR